MKREPALIDRSGDLEQSRQPDGTWLIEGFDVRPLWGPARTGGLRRVGWSVLEFGVELARPRTLTEARDFIRAQKGF
jgi:hypothetical protein